MNNEIKEKIKAYYIGNDIDKVLDYITNLQQIEQEHQRINGELREENSKLKIALQNIQEDYDRRIEENERLKEYYELMVQFNEKNLDRFCDYKSRCEKASEKLGNYKHYSTPTEEQNSENEDIVDSALNILQNGSEKK